MYLAPVYVGVLIHSPTGDQVRVAEQNAGQILQLVKETFPSMSFNQNNSSDVCRDTSNHGLQLACLWSRFQKLDQEDAPRNEDDKSAALEAVSRSLLGGV